MPDNTSEEKTWQQRFEKEFLSEDFSPLMECTQEDVKDFITKEIALAKAEGRREGRQDERFCCNPEIKEAYRMGRAKFKEELLWKMPKDKDHANESISIEEEEGYNQAIKEITDLIGWM